MATGTRLTNRKGQGFTRDLGWKIKADGKRIQPRFLLGRDQRMAELANLKLEALWDKIVAETEQRNAAKWFGHEPEQPLWTDVTLRIADAIRKGKPTVVIPPPRPDDIGGPTDDNSYATWLHHLQSEYGNLIALVPEDEGAMRRGQEQHQHVAEHRARQARRNAAIAKVPIPDTGTHQTLYAAIEAYAQYAVQARTGGANEPKDARSCRDGLPDMTLDQFNYDAIQRLGDYWRSRPPSRRHGAKGAPIAINTVNNRLKTSRRFIRWLHRSDNWQWRAPDDWQHALRFSMERLLSEDERLAMAEGPETWTVEELVTLYRYATDRERVLLLMGINLGYAQSEAISFRKVDLILDTDPPHIRRVRRKTGKLFKASLWPETMKGIEWLGREQVEPKDNQWVLLTERGSRPTAQHIANTWNALLDRVQKDLPDFRRLPYKHLRKTAYQLVLEAGGSSEVAGTFQGRGQLSSDEQADRYGRRLFSQVFDALGKVHDRLAPMFATAPDAFTSSRPKGSPNLSRAKIAHIRQLRRNGMSVVEIARAAGVSRNTVYRWTMSEAA